MTEIGFVTVNLYVTSLIQAWLGWQNYIFVESVHITIFFSDHESEHKEHHTLPSGHLLAHLRPQCIDVAAPGKVPQEETS